MIKWKINLVLIIGALFTSVTLWGGTVGALLAGLYGITSASTFTLYAIAFLGVAKLLYGLYFAASFRMGEIPFPFSMFDIGLDDIIRQMWGLILIITGLIGYGFAGAIGNWILDGLLWTPVAAALFFLGAGGIAPSIHGLFQWRRMRAYIHELEEQLTLGGQRDPYKEALELFDLAEGFTREDLKARYHDLQRRVHPDLGGSNGLARIVNDAYTLLKSPQRG